MNRALAVAASVVAFSFMASSQSQVTTVVQSGGVSSSTMCFGAIGSGFPANVIPGAPYSAEEVRDTERILADGTRITQHLPTTKIFRDSMGRIRTERSFRMPMEMGAQGQAVGPVRIEIVDPVAKVRYFLDPQAKIAHRIAVTSGQSGCGASHIGQPGGLRPTLGTTSQPSGAVPRLHAVGPNPRAHQVDSEQLGTETIEGVVAEGRRITRVYPAGSVGNDRDFTVTNEDWYSPELKLEVMHIVNDPRIGQSTFRLMNLNTGEPDPALFEPPEDYTVKDEEGKFSITWNPMNTAAPSAK